MVFLLVMTILALIYQLWEFVSVGNWLLVAMDILILVAAAMVALEAMSAFIRERRRLAAEAGAG
jgi:carbon starvation protein